MALDPVCGASVDREHPGARENFKGHTYYFCSDRCKTEFDKHPNKYASPAAILT